MIGILDFNIGNHFSVLKIFQKLRVDAVITSDHALLATAEKLVLPGVGNFASCITAFRQSGLVPLLEDAVLGRGVPLLGICVGMQMLTSFSEEGDCEGLGWIPAQTKRFPSVVDGQPLRVPHVGWNSVEGVGPLFQGLSPGSRYYFTHSYCVESDDPAVVTGRSTYGIPFASAIQCGRIYGVQFHPEKSHNDGLTLLRNFAEFG